MVSLTIAFAATFVSEHYGGPAILSALLIGMSFNFLAKDAQCQAGIELSAGRILRVGVALLGLRITADQILGLDVQTIIMVICTVVATIVVGRKLAQSLKLSTDFGLLSGGAVAICGAAAALALSSTMPKNEQTKRITILVVVGATTLSTIAMVLYPFLVTAMAFDFRDSGIFLGASIHGVAQVVGSGYMISPDTGDIATIVKLLRIALLFPAVLVFSFMFRRQKGIAEDRPIRFVPGFLVAFAAFVVLASLGVIPEAVTRHGADLSHWCLITAVAALGVKTSFGDLALMGWRPIAVMVGETLFLAVLVLMVVMLPRAM